MPIWYLGYPFPLRIEVGASALTKNAGLEPAFVSFGYG